MFPYWSRSTEAALMALQRAAQEKLAEREAAVERLAETQRTEGITPPAEPTVMRGVRITLLPGDGAQR